MKRAYIFTEIARVIRSFSLYKFENSDLSERSVMSTDFAMMIMSRRYLCRMYAEERKSAMRRDLEVFEGVLAGNIEEKGSPIA